jgi:DNA repair protein RecO (recombination protein O)
MERNATCNAIVLRNYRIGEMHKGAVLLTDRFGLLSAIAHGAYSQKGKLRGVTNPFCDGLFYLYTNPARNSTKVTDVEITQFHHRLREDLNAFYAASLWAEIVVKSFGGGDDGEALYGLLKTALGRADKAAGSGVGAEVGRVSLQFIWRYLAVIGVRPQLRVCAASGAGIEPDDPAAYSRIHGGIVSQSYAEPDDVPMSTGARRYLEHTQNLSLDDAVAVQLDSRSLADAKRALFALAQDTVESPLNTLKIGHGFL